ncbi:Histidine kinase A [Tieghemostelium lacteum]|uniref:Histidine kinase A n=1 Tax=Tieghemostelium lacteum TaxID=361077 RepID=A0A152A5S6_TIELA|nr:Histidine kinase A [Tieghemostelium lacteum]|eukprot:KYR01586.1 Histidine kinase A [Tieghemostelium lacteum]
MFTSSRMMTLIKSTLPTMIITMNLNKIMRKNMVEIIKYFSVVHKLVLYSPNVECILQLKSIDILELQEFSCPKEHEESVLQHLSTVVNDELILNNYQITTINNNIESLKGIYQRIKRLHLDRLSSQFMKFDNYDHITSLKTTCTTIRRYVEIEEGGPSRYLKNTLKSKTPIETIPITLPTHIPQFLSQKHFSSLQELCLNSKSINDEILLNLSKSSKLKILSLKNSDKVTDIGLIALCHHLSKLVVYNLSEITDRSLSHCFMLRDLFISECPKVRGDCFQILCNTLESIDLGKSLKYIQPNKYYDSYQCFSKIRKVSVSMENYDDLENDWDPMNLYSHLPLLTHIDRVASSRDLSDEILSQLTRIQRLEFDSFGINTRYTDQGIKQMIDNRDPNAGVIELSFWTVI